MTSAITKLYLTVACMCIASYLIGYTTPQTECIIRTGLPACSINRGHVCTKEGCFIAPRITERGPPVEHLFNAQALPSFIVFQHKVGWVLFDTYNTSTMTTVACIDHYIDTSTHIEL